MIGLVLWIFLVLAITLIIKNYSYYYHSHKEWAIKDYNSHYLVQKMKYNTFVKTYPLIKNNLTVDSSKNCNFCLTIPAKEKWMASGTYKLLFSYIDWLRLKLFFHPSKKTNVDEYQHKEVYIYLQKVCQDELQKADNMINKAYDEMKKHLEENK
jgi:hypothetical protein